MTYTFTIDKESFATYPKILSGLEAILKNSNSVSNEKEYNKIIHNIVIELGKEKFSRRSPLFAKEIASANIASPLIEKTVWGCVSIKKVDTVKDFIQKLLVIKQHGILGFEIHNRKLEKLNVLEGICLFISSQHKSKNWKKGQVTLTLGKKGSKITLQPGDEHGIIALTNSVIEETSTNYLDDLIFIFSTKQTLII